MNEEKDYISVKEFIKVVDRTEQSIYKRLKNKDDELNNYAKKFSHGIKLHKNAVREVYARDLTDEQIFGLIGRVEKVEPKVEEIKQLDYTREKQEEEKKKDKELIEVLEREIEKKDKIIEDLTKSLNYQQQLSLADKQTILQLQEINEQKPKKWNIFNFFKRK